MADRDMATIAAIEAAEAFEVVVEWADGSRQSVDLAPEIMGYTVYAPLRANPELFAAMRIEDDGATVVLSDEIDMPTDTIWDLSQQSMSDGQFRAFLERWGLTYDAAAAALGLSRRQVAYFAADKPIPRTVFLACRGYEGLHERGTSNAA